MLWKGHHDSKINAVELKYDREQRGPKRTRWFGHMGRIDDKRLT